MLSLGLWFLLFLLSSKSDSRWILEVRLHHYTNPTSLTRSGSCCDSDGVFDGQCDDPCDNTFSFCLRPSVSSPACQYGIYRTGLVTGGDNLTFTDGELIGQNAVSNPLIFNGTQWPDNDELYFLTSINDIDDSLLHFIDSFGTTLSVSNDFSNVMTLRGTVITGISLQVSYNMSCDQDYYGSQCDVFCQPTDDNTGHYTCDSEGNQICNTGYQMNETNCTTPICDDPVCNSNQQCVSPNSCVCRDGWTEIKCSSTVSTVTSSPTFISTNAVSPTSISTTAVSSPTSISTNAVSPTSGNTTSTNAVSSPTSVASSNTTTAIIGSMVALLVTVAVVVFVIIVTLFVLIRRKNSHSPKKGQDNGHSLDDPNCTHSATAATAGPLQPDFNNEWFLMNKNPVYGPLIQQGTQLPNSNSDTQTDQYSLACIESEYI